MGGLDKTSSPFAGKECENKRVRGKGEMGQQEESGWVLLHLSPPSDPEV